MFGESFVVDSRESNGSIRRRRECQKCSKRFTTYEKMVFDLFVVKKDGRSEPFDRKKLHGGVLRAFEKRPISEEEINSLVDAIESRIRQHKGREISTKIIGDIVMRQLKKMDGVAYMRFASVYKDFTDVHAFTQEINALEKRGK